MSVKNPYMDMGLSCQQHQHREKLRDSKSAYNDSLAVHIDNWDWQDFI